MSDLPDSPAKEVAIGHDAIEAIFPTPPGIEAVWVVEALLSVFDSVPWAAELLGGEDYRSVLQRILEHRLAAIHTGHEARLRTELTGQYAAAGLMIGRRGELSVPSIQTFRALIWLTLKHAGTGRHATHVRDLAYAVRAASNVRGDRSSPLNEVLPSLAAANCLKEAVEGLAPLGWSTHQTLRNIWVNWLRPSLEALEKNSSSPRREPRPEGPQKPLGTGGNSKARGQSKPPKPATRIERLFRSRPSSGQLPHEPPEEFTEPTELVTLQGIPVGLAQGVRRFYAQQAIWYGNRYLLTDHVDALPGTIYGALMRELTDVLLNEPPLSDTAMGAIGCLLKGLTGRTTAGLMAVQVTHPELGPSDPLPCMDLDPGLLWIPVFWKQELASRDEDRTGDRISYFRPNQLQAPLVAPVANRLALPLPTVVRQALKRHSPTLLALQKTEPQTFDDAMARVMKGAARKLDVVASVGCLRRALGPLLYERYGDLALAQLICGESFGLTAAPLHYYAPTLRSVAEAYSDLLAEHFGGSAMPRIPAWGTRIGSELLVTPATVRSLTSSSRSLPSMRDGTFSPLDEYIHEHHRLTDHLARMILATSGHRPGTALFEITLADIDLSSGAALLRDKRHDVAHDPRLATLPRVTTDQITAYVEHLRRLLALRPDLKGYIASVLDGELPLLFDLSGDGGVFPMSLERLIERSPAEWSVLPWNWSRTWIRTMAIEAGAPAYLVAAQLGHFDSIGYPYSNQSPTDPIDLVEAMRPWLDRLARRAGWEVLHSGLRPTSSCVSEFPQGPLENWTVRVDVADAAASNAHRAWERRIRTERHRLREEAIEAVLNHPAFLAGDLASSYRNTGAPVRGEALTSLNVEAIRNELVLEAEDDAILAVARIRALSRVMKTLSARAELQAPNLPIPIPVRRPLDNPFFPGCCRALSQVTALREHVQERGKLKAPIRTFELQVARTAEALALFGGIDQPAILMDVLAARTKAVPSAKLVDLLLVPLDDGRTVAIRGIAALALAALANDFPMEEVPSLEVLELKLADLMPAWALTAGPSSLLIALCSTVRVSNRFELSPAARFALDERTGSVPATIDEQLALIDGDPVGPARAEPSTMHPAADPQALQDSRAHPARGDTARRQYNQLVQMIPKRGRDLQLPLTGRRISAAALNTRATRDAVTAELQAWLGTPDHPTRLFPISRMLGEWVFSELQRPRPGGRRLADTTVATYLTRIGSALVQMLGDEDSSKWDETKIEDAYAYALYSSDKAKAKVAAALLSFHRFNEMRFDLPDVDLGSVYALLGSRKRHVDSGVVLPAERERALAELDREARQSADHCDARRARMAQVTAIWLARAGARLGEPLGFRVRDIGRTAEGKVYVRITSNRLRALKTAAGRRIADLGNATAEEGKIVWAWREAVRSKIKASRSGGAYLVAELEQPRAFGELPDISRKVRQALAAQTGRTSERLHRLRHLVAHEGITRVALAVEDAASMGQAAFKPDSVIEPRDFAAVSVPIGHSHWLTTLQAYFHVPWILQSRATARSRRKYLNRKFLPGALGYTPAFFDSLLRDRPEANAADVWFARFRSRRKQPEDHKTANLEALPRWHCSARALGQLLNTATRCASLSEALRLTGAPMDVEDQIRTLVFHWEMKIGRRLIPPVDDDVSRPKRALRRTAGDALAERLWDLFDQDPQACASLLFIAQSVFVHADTRPGEHVRLLDEFADALVGLLLRVGIDDSAVQRKRVGPGISQVMLITRGNDKTGRWRPVGLRRVLAVLNLTGQLRDQLR